MKIALVDAQKQLLLAVNHEGELKNTTALTAGENQIFIERPLAGVLDGLHLQIVYTPFIFGEIPNWGYQLILILIGLTGALLVGSIVYFYGRDRVASHQLQLQNDWVLNLAHALRGPCHALGVLTEAMKANSETDNDELFVLAQRELETMDNHCRQFLQLARQEKKAVDRKLEPLELQPLLRQAISRVLLRYPQLDKKAVTLQDIPPVKVRGNYEAAGESFITVIDNALKYSLHKKEVAVNAVANDSQVCLEIADQGLGIAPDELPQIGQAFYRSDRPDFEGINGTGVGLYLAFAASEAMGWQMQIESDGVGKGSKVIFTIPVVKK
jgi:signal transduction histidine kinase